MAESVDSESFQLFPNGTPDAAVVLELYQTYVANAEAVVARRHSVNTFFLSVNTLVLSAVALVTEFGRNQRTGAVAVAIFGITGLVLSAVWQKLIVLYGRQRQSMFVVVYLLEDAIGARLYQKRVEGLERIPESSGAEDIHSERSKSSVRFHRGLRSGDCYVIPGCVRRVACRVSLRRDPSGHLPKVFLCYSSFDRSRAAETASAIRSSGCNVWSDWDAIGCIGNWRDHADTAIRGCDAFVLLISEHSISSENCRWEIGVAIDARRPAVGLLIDDSDPALLGNIPSSWKMMINSIHSIRCPSVSAQILRTVLTS